MEPLVPRLPPIPSTPHYNRLALVCERHVAYIVAYFWRFKIGIGSIYYPRLLLIALFSISPRVKRENEVPVRVVRFWVSPRLQLLGHPATSDNRRSPKGRPGQHAVASAPSV
jgi:hypothetical protein